MITTLNTNIGDDLIREGIIQVLHEVYSGRKLEFVLINKHQPYSVYPRRHPISLAHSVLQYLPCGNTKLTRYSANMFYRNGGSRFDSCDLILQCGTPVLWPNCSQCEWAEPLWDQVVGRLSNAGKSVVNLGAGSCYPWENQPEAVENPEDANYLGRILDYCRVTTVRDELAQKLLAPLGHICPLIPCPAFLAAGRFNIQNKPEYFIINYMEKAGHYEWDQKIDGNAWKQTMKAIIHRIKKTEKPLFLCHNQNELQLTEELDSSIPRFLPKSIPEFFSVLSTAKAALCNRLHASVAMAGFGVPAISVGTDTRLQMAATLKLPVYYVKEASENTLIEATDNILKNREEYSERLMTLRQRAFQEYVTIMNQL
ncbi:polysaccharide pyruvyl transferase family protein [bacterium]|nr:polysaccharide pyruvyl transferase family protein [bacterium]